jgi:serine/threonine protein phosphatase 1
MGMTYVVGDIHGCIDQLRELLNELFMNGMVLTEDTLIFVGDYIDRGPDSKGVIDLMMDMQNLYGDNVVCLKGNHEDMCLHNYKYYEPRENDRELGIAWCYNGGIQALESYRAWAELHKCEPQVSKEHLDWMLTLPTMYENELGYYVHAGFDPWLDTPEQCDDYQRMWIRHDWIQSSKDFGKTVYFGHTAAKGHTTAKDFKLGIDTACVYGFKLTAIRVDDQKVFQVDGWTKPAAIKLGD